MRMTHRNRNQDIKKAESTGINERKNVRRNNNHKIVRTVRIQFECCPATTSDVLRAE